ncbi:MAG: DUF1287 domain-containing protein [Armatimonadota bacterium]|nr:DUF1287 domain-containing protein [Armatimonadota bacterium]
MGRNIFLTALTLSSGCGHAAERGPVPPPVKQPVKVSVIAKVVNAAEAQMRVTRVYDPAYTVIAYPNGDVAPEKGVCSDVIIRAFRVGGVDLQRLVHEDMRAHFRDYPQLWGLRRTDPNIDHRRVANLMRFFTRRGVALSLSKAAGDYRPGDVVAWHLPNGRLHIGLVSDTFLAGRPLMVHNIGAGTQLEDVLFAWPVIGHYRYFRT